jgi:hypothetical protein
LKRQYKGKMSAITLLKEKVTGNAQNTTIAGACWVKPVKRVKPSRNKSRPMANRIMRYNELRLPGSSLRPPLAPGGP